MTAGAATAVNPFPGLRPFLGDDKDLQDHPFFGREEQTDDLLFRLRRQRFLAVVGTSGSGKSSLVRAGLLPALHGGYMAGVGSGWRVALLRPELDPIGNLAAALADPAVTGAGLDREMQVQFTRAVLQHSSRGLVEVVQQAQLPNGVKVLVLVDQFEELFRFKNERAGAQTADQAAAFVKLLLEATSSPGAPVYVVLTMRSDFLGDCAQFRDLPELINDGLYLVPRMKRDQLQFAIEGPVRVAGGAIDPLLVTRLLNDVGDDPDQLPVLQHALMRTWDWAAEHGPGKPLSVADYEAIGTMNEALSLHADHIYANLNSDHQGVAERLFRCLTDARTDPRGIRRPTRFEDACAITGACPADLTAVVEQFNASGRSFLMPPAGEPLPGRILDISHESLMRQWSVLQHTWLGEEAEAGAVYARLVAAATTGTRRLWHDEELALGLAWQKKNEGKINATWAARYDADLPPQAPAELTGPRFDQALSFLAQSEAAGIAERKRDADLQRADLLARTRRRQVRTVAVIVGVFFIIASALVVFAAHEHRAAVVASKAATSERIKAERVLATATAQRAYNGRLVTASLTRSGATVNDACQRALTYTRISGNDATSSQAAYDAAMAGLNTNAQCSDPQAKLVNEAYLLSMRAPAERALRIGNWQGDLTRANALLAECASRPGLKDTAAGKDCQAQLFANGVPKQQVTAPEPQPSTPPAKNPVVYIHYNNTGEGGLAEDLRTTLAADGGVRMAPIERVPGAYDDSVRYFHPNDRAAAERVAAAVRKFFTRPGSSRTFRIVDLSPKKDAANGPLEVWMR
jgi:energy-coupling factor transporter ATP-binding protein EcfA2